MLVISEEFNAAPFVQNCLLMDNFGQLFRGGIIRSIGSTQS
ncbi:hypothetical protein [Cylindrospermopsis curvispora]|nr:hypothetical protein [Cylindrospermopsis curvispora]